jgi:predicted patatin/cPLA2 family phospholipase
MTIKHLALAGGGISGLAGIGAIHHLFDSNILKIEEIKSIYGTSVGSIMGLFICFYKLGISIENIKDYIIQRPFHETYKISMNQIIQIYEKKGIYDKNAAIILFKPFFQTIDLSTEITMKELYELTSIELYFYTVEINNYVLKELSYINTPDLSVIEAIYMSSTLPLIMCPLIRNNECFVDGGFLCNYPIQECLKNESLKNESLKNESLKNESLKNENVEKEILGINYNYFTLQKIINVTEKTSVIDYIITILNNIIIILSNSKAKDNTSKKYYEIDIPINWTFNSFINIFCCQKERQKFYELGMKTATDFIASL